MTDIKKGDRVKVTLEGEVLFQGDRSIEARVEDGRVVEVYAPRSPLATAVIIEKIEPPVKVFKPGDVVQNSAHVYALTPHGFVVLDDGVFYGYGEGGRYKVSDFTSETFDRTGIAKP